MTVAHGRVSGLVVVPCGIDLCSVPAADEAAAAAAWRGGEGGWGVGVGVGAEILIRGCPGKQSGQHHHG
jgi:hypothetical protein